MSLSRIPKATHLAALLLVLGAAAPRFAPESPVRVEYDRERDFSRYETYAWSTTAPDDDDEAVHLRIVRTVDASLERLGLRRDDDEPDLRIRYRLEREKTKVHVRSTQKRSAWDPTDVETSIRLGSHEEATLSLEIADAETNAIIWRAWCRHRTEEAVEDVVERLLDSDPTSTP